MIAFDLLLIGFGALIALACIGIVQARDAAIRPKRKARK